MSFNGRVVSTGEHDDLVMAFWICNNAILKGNFSFAFGEQIGDKEVYEADMREMMGDPEEDDMDEFVLGMRPQGRGRPRRINAQLVQDLAEDGESGADSRQDATTQLKPYSEVAPTLGAPKLW